MRNLHYLLLAGAAVAGNALGALKINEVYYNVSPQGGNQFVELYNAGSTNCYLDGMILTDEAGTGNEGVFKFPGAPGGTSFPVVPAQYVVIAVDATGATLSAHWECYAGGTDTDNPSVSNLSLVSGNTDLSLFSAGDGLILGDGSSTTAPISALSVVDGMNYGGGDGELAPLSSTATDPAPDPAAPTNTTLSRCGNGNDTDISSSADFAAQNPTRGLPNSCVGPDISVGDTFGLETDTGTPVFVFTVYLSQNNAQPVTVNYATSNGTATAGSDFTGISNTLLTFPAGVTSKTVNVTVLGDTQGEAIEQFYVALYTPTNGSLSKSVGIGTIVDDDAVPGFIRFVRGGNTVTTTWSMVTGQVYQAQYSPQLTSPVWTNLGNAVTATVSSASVADPTGGITQRFYRVLLLQY